MSLRRMILLTALLSCSLWMIGCGVLKWNQKEVLHDSNVPVAEVYDQAGQRLAGYEGYAKGYVANMVKRCDAILDRLDREKP